MQSHDRAFDGLLLQRLQEDINLLVVMIQRHGWNGVMMDSSMLSNDVNANKFSRFEWYEAKGQLFYCQQVFDAASAADAADFTKVPAADSSDANDRGCGAKGQFAWSELILLKKLEIATRL
jgi:hypothetical protein